MATMVGRGKIQLAEFDGPFTKLQHICKKSRRHLLHKPSCSQFCPKFCCHGNGGRSEEIAIGSIRWPIPENPPIAAKRPSLSIICELVYLFIHSLVRPKAIACGADFCFTPDVFFLHSRNLRDAWADRREILHDGQ